MHAITKLLNLNCLITVINTYNNIFKRTFITANTTFPQKTRVILGHAVATWIFLHLANKTDLHTHNLVSN